MSAITDKKTDVINEILGLNENGPVAALRNQKPQLAAELQAYYESLFEPVEPSAAAFPLADRYLVALRVASHTKSSDVVQWYERLASQAGVSSEVIARIRNTGEPWSDRTPLGAAIRHTDLVTTAPANTRASHLQALKDAGYTPAGILSLAQIIAFVNYQLRLIAGLRAFGETV